MIYWLSASISNRFWGFHRSRVPGGGRRVQVDGSVEGQRSFPPVGGKRYLLRLNGNDLGVRGEAIT